MKNVARLKDTKEGDMYRWDRVVTLTCTTPASTSLRASFAALTLLPPPEPGAEAASRVGGTVGGGEAPVRCRRI